MRSRFSAFAVADESYLLKTWHLSTRPDVLDLDSLMRWTNLDIIDAVRGGPFDTTGIVEFRANYRIGDARGVLHERSNFTHHNGQWVYVGGELRRPYRQSL
jgi:SEC-C motif-containing protein